MSIAFARPILENATHIGIYAYIIYREDSIYVHINERCLY